MASGLDTFRSRWLAGLVLTIFLAHFCAPVLAAGSGVSGQEDTVVDRPSWVVTAGRTLVQATGLQVGYDVSTLGFQAAKERKRHGRDVEDLETLATVGYWKGVLGAGFLATWTGSALGKLGLTKVRSGAVAATSLEGAADELGAAAGRGEARKVDWGLLATSAVGGALGVAMASGLGIVGLFVAGTVTSWIATELLEIYRSKWSASARKPRPVENNTDSQTQEPRAPELLQAPRVRSDAFQELVKQLHQPVPPGLTDSYERYRDSR